MVPRIIRKYYVLFFIILMTSLGETEVITSSVKMVELAAVEESWLEMLRSRISAGPLREFVDQRSRDLRPFPEAGSADTASHPNSAYLLIKTILTKWYDIMRAHPAMIEVDNYQRALLPTYGDLQGAMSAIVRLQRVFGLRTAEMYAGNYSGHVGPALKPMDAYELGRRSFTDSEPHLSVSWLELALRKGGSGVGPFVSGLTSASQMPPDGMTKQEKAAVMGLMGRAYLYAGQIDKAAEIHRQSRSIDPEAGDVQALERELVEAASKPKAAAVSPYMANTTFLCSRGKHQTLTKVRPYHVCRFRPSLWIPYVTYKEELLSLSPYASLFYDIIYEDEIKALKEFVRGRLTRGLVERYDEDPHFEISTVRTSDLGWVRDHELSVAARLSARVEDITWLETQQRPPDGPDSGENLQVVNYGLGGHYSAHWDPVKMASAPELQQSGTRIATFLFYLSDVEKGGQTAFVNAGISVAPVKGMALFWYNYNPAMELEELSLHTGCPVLKGHKWIANKWIWTYGNTFRRPCGPSPNTTQLELEDILYKSRFSNDDTA